MLGNRYCAGHITLLGALLYVYLSICQSLHKLTQQWSKIVNSTDLLICMGIRKINHLVRLES